MHEDLIWLLNCVRCVRQSHWACQEGSWLSSTTWKPASSMEYFILMSTLMLSLFASEVPHLVFDFQVSQFWIFALVKVVVYCKSWSSITLWFSCSWLFFSSLNLYEQHSDLRYDAGWSVSWPASWLAHECQDLLSLCDEVHVCTD